MASFTILSAVVINAFVVVRLFDVEVPHFATAVVVIVVVVIRHFTAAVDVVAKAVVVLVCVRFMLL